MSGEYAVMECHGKDGREFEDELKVFYDKGGLAKAKAYCLKQLPNALRRAKKSGEKNFSLAVIDFFGHVHFRLK